MARGRGAPLGERAVRHLRHRVAHREACAPARRGVWLRHAWFCIGLLLQRACALPRHRLCSRLCARPPAGGGAAPSTPGPTAATTPTASKPASNGSRFSASAALPKYLRAARARGSRGAQPPTFIQQRARQSMARSGSLRGAQSPESCSGEHGGALPRGCTRAATLGGAGAAPRRAPACGVVDVGGVDGRVSPADEHVACVRVAPHRPSGLAHGAARHKSEITMP